MNFLQLCQAVARDSGTVAGVPNFTTVTGATGRIAQVIGWTNDAWQDIQSERNDWKWMRRTFTGDILEDTATYTPAALGLTRVGAWLPDRPEHSTFTIYDPAIGQADEGAITQISFDLWRQRYARGVHDAKRPSEWAISPDNELLIGPTPDKAYKITGEYRRSPQTLSANDDTPEMPAQFHRVIVAEAIRIMAQSDEAFQAMGAYANQYVRLRNALVIDQTPTIDMWAGGPLA